jgi:integrase/recombinase XerD
MSDLIPVQQLPFTVSILAGTVGPSSMRMYERDFKAYLEFAGTPEMAVQPMTLARWRTALSANTMHSPKTINRMLSAVKSLMSEAETQGFIPKGTSEEFKRVRGVKVEALKHRQKIHARTRISPEEMRTLTSLPDPLTLVGIRDTALLHTLASSGLRVDELATLKQEQIITKEQGYQLRVMGKNDAVPRDAPLSPEAHQAILEWLARRPISSPFIFTSFKGKGNRPSENPMRPVSIWRIVKGYADQCGIEHIKPHDFRRYVGTQLAKKNPRVAQKALGHKNINTTMDNYVLDELEVGVTDNLY